MIKVSSLNSSLHESTAFDQLSASFIDRVADALGQPIELSPIGDYDCDLKLIFISSGGSEGLFLQHFAQLKAPYIILTQGTNNSLAASLEILTYLNKNNLPGEVLHGSTAYIAQRITELMGGSAAAKSSSCNRQLAKKVDLGVHYGVIGQPSDWLIASVPGDSDALDQFGVKLEHIALEEVIAAFNAIADEDGIKDNLDFGSALRCAKAITQVQKAHGLDGLTIRCFDLLTAIRTTGCLGLSQLNDQGIIATCEGDVMAMISMGIAKAVGAEASFQCNPSVIDSASDTCVLAHCTIPTKMLTKFHYDTHFESKIGVAIKGYLKETDVTVLRLSSDLKTYFVSEGKILRSLEEEQLCRTQIEVQLEPGTAQTLLHAPCGNHHVVFYGKHKQEIIDLLG